MSLLTIFVLAIGLGVDAFSVAIGIGAANKARSWLPVVRLSFAFGIFQFVMPLIQLLDQSMRAIGAVDTFGFKGIKFA